MSCPACLMMAGNRGMGQADFDLPPGVTPEAYYASINPAHAFDPNSLPLPPPVKDVIPGIPNKYLFVAAIGIGVVFALAAVKKGK
jgi:hypothetical protein